MNDRSYETATAKVVVDTARQIALKTRKPVNLTYLNYETRALRWKATRRELELACRYSPHTYLGIWSRASDGSMIEHELEELEPVLVMHLLDDADRLDSPSKHTNEVGVRVARELVDKHETACPDTRLDGYGSVSRVRENWEVNFREILPQGDSRLPITADARSFIVDRMEAWLDRNVELLERRIVTGRVRDLHGDMRVEHVYVGDQVHFIDPLEFRDDWRVTDVAAELAFLTMELDSIQAEAVGEALIGEYTKRSGDKELIKLLPFYKTYYAVVRARVAWVRSLQQKDQESEQLKKCGELFDLALIYVERYLLPR